MIKFVNAKINLGLHVLRRRPDGYHDLSTLFYPVGKYAGSPLDRGGLCDVLEVTPADSDVLEVAGELSDCPVEDNLVWRALQLYRTINPDMPPVRISLHKHLPSQAGLGGGSADASFALLAFNELCGGAVSHGELLAASLRLGADCPFFILNRPCMASGVGELLEPFELDLSGLWCAVLKPAKGISTAEAFRYVVPRIPDMPLDEILRRPMEQWRDLLVNDFEQSMFSLHSEIRSLKDYLYKSGAVYASMSGSGSAFYGIFESEEQAFASVKNADVPYSTIARL